MTAKAICISALSVVQSFGIGGVQAPQDSNGPADGPRHRSATRPGKCKLPMPETAALGKVPAARKTDRRLSGRFLSF